MPKIEYQPPTITCKHMCMLRVRRIGASAAGMLRSPGCPLHPWLPTGEARVAPGRPARPGGWQTRAAAARVRMCMCACIIWHCDRIAHARNRAAATAAQPPPRVRAHPPGARVRRKKRAGIPTSRLKVFEIITHSTDQAHAGIRAHEPSESMWQCYSMS